MRRVPDPGFKEQFTIDGHAPRKGELWKNPNLANTLQQIADGGRDAFYKDDIARTIGAYFRANGRYLSYEDMASHQGEWVEPVSTIYRGYDVWELPPNSQGIAALQMLNILEGYDFSKIPFGSAEHVHLFTEAKKLAFADRARFYADPAFQPAPLAKLISKDYASRRRALISMDKALKEVQPGTPKQDGKPWLSFGVMGGAMQPQGHVQIVMNLVDFHMNLQEAGDAPRIQHEGSTEPTGQATAMSDGGEVNLETGFSYDTIRALMRKGHRVIFADGPYGGYQAIARDLVSGVYYGASESRKDGQAAGY